jgi:hypothetical protein
MATLVKLHREIDARMHLGGWFSSIEDEVINPSGLSDDQSQRSGSTDGRSWTRALSDVRPVLTSPSWVEGDPGTS